MPMRWLSKTDEPLVLLVPLVPLVPLGPPVPLWPPVPEWPLKLWSTHGPELLDGPLLGVFIILVWLQTMTGSLARRWLLVALVLP